MVYRTRINYTAAQEADIQERWSYGTRRNDCTYSLIPRRPRPILSSSSLENISTFSIGSSRPSGHSEKSYMTRIDLSSIT